jgi:predicted anti-sigma-YlaC factor YlaD
LDQHCSEETLSAFLDGDLESEASGETAEHLAECEVCRASLAQVRRIRDAAPGLEQLEPPERAWGAIQDRIHSERTRRSRLMRLFWVGAPALAAALLVVAVAGWLGQPTRDAIRSVAHLGHAHGQGMATAVSDLSKDGAAEQVAREYGEYVRGIDCAIGECRTALDENPGNARVLAAYSGASSDRRRAMDRLASGGE